jgi:hypothetical protein
VYPNTQLQFSLKSAATVRVLLLARVGGSWRVVAKASIQGRSGANSDRLAGRWHGRLVPARPIRLQVEIKSDGHWTIERTLALTVRHEHRS